MNANAPEQNYCSVCYHPKDDCQCKESRSFAAPHCSTDRLDDAIETAKRKAVDELNTLDWHEGDLRKMNIIERAIRSVIAEMSNGGTEAQPPNNPKR